MTGPPFGTASAYADAFPQQPPKELTVGAETCWNLSVFRNVVRQYRKLDDQVVTRLNRAAAQLRDEEREGKGGSPEGMCAAMWSEMMAGWIHRQTLLTYCQNTVNSSLAAKQAAASSTAPADAPLAEQQQRYLGVTAHERGMREDQAVADQLANEASIEAIIRKRTLDVFKSRCQFFQPNTPSGRAWWDLADRGRAGTGPVA